MKKFFHKLSGNKIYYSLVVLCVVAVGSVVTTVIKDNINESAKRNLALSEGVQIPEITTQIPASSEPYTAPVIAPKNQKTESSKDTKPNEDPSLEEAEETFGKKFIIEPPVAGQVINPFSGEELVYDKTFDDWRVHTGIDIAAERSTPVNACAAGVIDEVSVDPMNGITIMIDHGNHYQSIYTNLSSDKMVKKGERVEKGQTISGVGETSIAEAGLPSHLHFELRKKEKYVDPESCYE